jgi:hypothetical protein
MKPIDCRMCKAKNCLHSVDTHINRIETAIVNSIVVCNHHTNSIDIQYYASMYYGLHPGV